MPPPSTRVVRGKPAAKPAAKPAVRGKPAERGFSDENAQWLKPTGRKRSLFEEEPEDDDDDDDEDEDDEVGESEDDEGDDAEGEEDEGDEDDYDEDEDEDDEDDELDFERKARATMAKLQADATANQEEIVARDIAQSSGLLPSVEE